MLGDAPLLPGSVGGSISGQCLEKKRAVNAGFCPYQDSTAIGKYGPNSVKKRIVKDIVHERRLDGSLGNAAFDSDRVIRAVCGVYAHRSITKGAVAIKLDERNWQAQAR
jgi:hypothetical protein